VRAIIQADDENAKCVGRVYSKLET
jgi:hypothetical protein